MKKDNVNHPSHYTWLKDKCGIEVLDITRHMDFNLGNAIKYILRAGHKKEKGMSDINKEIEDLQKARFYINDRIEMLMNSKVTDIEDQIKRLKSIYYNTISCPKTTATYHIKKKNRFKL